MILIFLKIFLDKIILFCYFIYIKFYIFLRSAHSSMCALLYTTVRFFFMYYSLELIFDNGSVKKIVIFQKDYSLVLKLVSSYLKDFCNTEKLVNDSSLVSFSLNPFYPSDD